MVKTHGVDDNPFKSIWQFIARTAFILLVAARSRSKAVRTHGSYTGLVIGDLHMQDSYAGLGLGSLLV